MAWTSDSSTSESQPQHDGADPPRPERKDKSTSDSGGKNKPHPPIFLPWTRFTNRYIHKGVPSVVIATALVAVRRPKSVISFVILLGTALIAFGATRINYNTEEFEIFAPFGARSVAHRDWLVDDSGFLEAPATFALLIHADGGNVAGVMGMRRLFTVLDTFRNVPDYNEVCSQSRHIDSSTGEHTCQISSATRFWNHNVVSFELSTATDQDVKVALSADTYPDDVPVDASAIMGFPKYDENGTVTEALSYMLLFLLPTSTAGEDFQTAALDQVLPLAAQWREEIGNLFRLEVYTERSYSDEFQRAIVKDMPLIPLVIVIMTVFTCFVFYRRDKAESRALLGLASIFTITMSLLSGFGFMFVCGVPFTNMTQLVPFVIFGVGLDDTFVIVGAFTHTDRRKTVEERVVDALNECGLSITVTTTTTVVAFAFGALSSLPAVRWLCLYALATVVIDFIYQITFFIAFMVLLERRSQAKHPVVVCDNDQDAQKSQSTNFIDRFMVWYAPRLLKPAVKLFTVVGFFAFLGVCAYSTSQLTQQFNVDELVPDGSYVTSFFDAFAIYSSRNLPIYAYFRYVNQSDDGIHQQMINYVEEFANLETFSDDISFCWIRDFKELLEDDPRAASLRDLPFNDQVDALLNIPIVQEVYGENIVRNNATGEIVASRCILYTESLDVNVVREQMDMLRAVNKISAEQPVNKNRSDWAFFSYDDYYLIWELYNTIVGEWISTTLLSVIAVTVIGFICMPDWTATLFLFPVIAMVYICVIGTIQFAGLYINVVSYVVLAMSIGLFVDYLMHVLLSYYEAPGKTREDKVLHTLRTVGSPVLVGALSTFLGVLPLAFSTSAVMRIVFICFITTVLLGSGCGLIFLPVVLSYCGPTDCGGPESREMALVTAKAGSGGDKKVIIASTGEVFGFVLGCGVRMQFLFVVGCLSGVMSGLIYPAMAFLFASALSSLSAAAADLEQIREASLFFVGLGIYALVFTSLQTACFEIVSTHASRKMRLQWFEALLRQDTAYFDIYDVASIASTIETNASAFQLGLGRKLGEGIEFGTAFVGGFAFAFYSSWRLALVIIAVLPVSLVSAYAVVTISQTKTSRARSAYASAGSVAYSTVSGIKTVLSLNAIKDVTRLYTAATREALRLSISGLWREGLATGCMVGAFMLLHCTLTLYGGYLVYSDVRDTGCDPSGGVDDNDTCDENGPSVFGAMLGVVFASQGIPAVSNFMETFTTSRVAFRKVLDVVGRKIGSPGQEIVEYCDETVDGDTSEPIVKAVLPPYLIDSSSPEGLQPVTISGAICFEGVEFYYPTRPTAPVLSGLNLEIKAGSTVALVGQSGSGKSTIVALIERFYDPTSGSVKLDGIDLKDLNVHYLRSVVAYVGQEPVIFATTIADNIRNGKPDATQDQIEQAAKLANAHNFIMSFPEGYNTHCGDNGAQLSGGQRQRLAIARALIGEPHILLLDEATSALDSESELAVQDALNNIVSNSRMTTVVVAHRLSTIRTADSIAFIGDGKVLEQGSHDELMKATTGHYRSLVYKQDGGKPLSSSSSDNPSVYIDRFRVDSRGSDPPASPSSLDSPRASSSHVDHLNGSHRTGPVDAPPSFSDLTLSGFARESANIADIPKTLEGSPSLNFIRSIVSPEGEEPHSALSSQEPNLLRLATVDISGLPSGLEIDDESPPDITDTLYALKEDQSIIVPITASVSADTSPMSAESGSVPLLAFRDVKFAYETRANRLVLDNFNLEIKRGETIALVGPSGGGKSTVMSLIQRFYDPLEGTVEWAGHDLKSLKVSWYRDQIGYVGQEPILFNTTIAKNIAFGASGVSQEEIEYAARMAYAHEFIVSQLPDGYNTIVGERGSQLSGGQRQRISIARAYIKKPPILLLDEATSALDTESERVVQGALETLMSEEDVTVIVIAHRLSTIQKADRFIHIENGTAVKISENKQLEDYYKNLLEYQSGGSRESVTGLGVINLNQDEEVESDDKSIEDAISYIETEEIDTFASVKRLLRMASPDMVYIVIGIIGALLVGGVFPVWGIMLAEAIDLLFERVEKCTGDFCQDYWDSVANEMQDQSFKLGGFWAVLFITTVTGFVLVFVGFGIAAERLTKRVRDLSFSALTRQEVTFYDKRSVGNLTSQLEDDAARIHAFTGEPVRSIIVAISSIFTGVAISLIYMWPFAVMSLFTIPLIGIAVQRNQQVISGRGEGVSVGGLGSPSAIVVDTLMNIRTISALTLERLRYERYENALSAAVPDNVFGGLRTGFVGGLTNFVQQSVTALQCYWGGWLMFSYSDTFQFEDFLISMLTLQFSIFGLGIAFQGLTNRKETVQSAERIFYLLDRKSKIDPTS